MESPSPANPCLCPAPNRLCLRAGVPMIGHLWERCSGQCPPERPCTPELSESFRRLWDSQPGAQTGAPPPVYEPPWRSMLKCLHIGTATGEIRPCFD